MEHLELRSMELELAARREAFRREHERDLSAMLRSNLNARKALKEHARELWAAARGSRREASASHPAPASERSLAAE